MTKLQYLGLVTAAGIACFSGSYLAARQPLEANAQTRRVPPNIKIEEYLHVPNGGLRMVNTEGRLIGVIGERNGAGQITLNGSNGQPSVVISAGSGGRISLTAGQNASGLQVEAQSGSMAQLIVFGREAMVSAGANKNSLIEMRAGSENSIVLPNQNGRKVLELTAAAGGPEISLSDDGGRPNLLFSGGKEPSVVLSSGDRKTEAVLHPKNGLEFRSGGKPIWTAPPKQLGGGGG